jgi:hypothetical protein
MLLAGHRRERRLLKFLVDIEERRAAQLDEWSRRVAEDLR